MHNKAPEIYAISAGFVFVEEVISCRQYGHIMWVAFGPTGTTVVTKSGSLLTENLKIFEVINVD